MTEQVVTEQGTVTPVKRASTSRQRELETIRAFDRVKEIRRLARNHLMHSRDLHGTRDEILNRAIKKATLIYDDVEAFPVKPKEVY